MRYQGRYRPERHQRGAIAIEFVVLFPLFLLMLYAIISYAVIMASQQALHSLSSEAARAAVAVNRNKESFDEEESVEEQLNARFQSVVQERVDNSWIGGWVSHCNEMSDYFTYTPGAGGKRDSLELCFQVTVGASGSLALPRLSLKPLGWDISIPSDDLSEIVSTSKIHL